MEQLNPKKEQLFLDGRDILNDPNVCFYNGDKRKKFKTWMEGIGDRFANGKEKQTKKGGKRAYDVKKKQKDNNPTKK